jgi:hypothetical protein
MKSYNPIGLYGPVKGIAFYSKQLPGMTEVNYGRLAQR